MSPREGSSGEPGLRSRRRNRLEIERVWPGHAIPGGRVDLLGRGFSVDAASRLRVFFGEEEAHVYRVSPARLGVRVPDNAGSSIRVSVGHRVSEPVEMVIGRPFAANLHVVANPVYDRKNNLYATFSGRRGEPVPEPIYRLSRYQDPKPLGAGITNPTGLAWGPDDALYVSSRDDGCVYRMSRDGEFDVFASRLGCATGLGFAPDGDLIVGDREGTLFRVNQDGDSSVFANMRPSISAYHLAFNSDGGLFVAAPTFSARDRIVEFDAGGSLVCLHSGFGRPQGIVFDSEDRLFVSEGLAGDAGVFLFSPTGARRIISGPPIVGLALGAGGNLAVATADRVYEFETGERLVGGTVEDRSFRWCQDNGGPKSGSAKDPKRRRK